MGNGPLGTIYKSTPSSQGSARSPAVLCQVLKEGFLNMEQPYVPQHGALTELFIKVGVKFSPLTAQSTQSQGQPPADRSAMLEEFSVPRVAFIAKSLIHWILISTLFQCRDWASEEKGNRRWARLKHATVTECTKTKRLGDKQKPATCTVLFVMLNDSKNRHKYN